MVSVVQSQECMNWEAKQFALQLASEAIVRSSDVSKSKLERELWDKAACKYREISKGISTKYLPSRAIVLKLSQLLSDLRPDLARFPWDDYSG